jgi:hypothetical protein
MSDTIYDCPNCTWRGTELDGVDDLFDRVNPGELMPAGECPECGALVELPDADIPVYVLNDVARIMRTRGWAVQASGTVDVPAAGDVMAATRRFLGRP